MSKDFYDTSQTKLQVNSAFRTPDEQAQINPGNNPIAEPGKSKHNQGKAIDVNSTQVTDLSNTGLLNKYGFNTIPRDPPHIEYGYKFGGIADGPMEGHEETLHGPEAVVPLPDGKTIPVRLAGNDDRSKLLELQLTKLDDLVRIMQSQLSVSEKILKSA